MLIHSAFLSLNIQNNKSSQSRAVIRLVPMAEDPSSSVLILACLGLTRITQLSQPPLQRTGLILGGRVATTTLTILKAGLEENSPLHCPSRPGSLPQAPGKQTLTSPTWRSLADISCLLIPESQTPFVNICISIPKSLMTGQWGGMSGFTSLSLRFLT